MIVHYGCVIPEDLYYHPEHDSWVLFDVEGRARLGMTDVAQTAAGKLLHIRFKSVGKMVREGRSAATIESAKWVGPFRMPFDGKIMATNQDAFRQDVLIANKDPYGSGWLVEVRPLNPNTARDNLLSGEDAVAFMKNKIEESNISCFRCADDPVPMDG